jgi:hypothetical protein
VKGSRKISIHDRLFRITKVKEKKKTKIKHDETEVKKKFIPV